MLISIPIFCFSQDEPKEFNGNELILSYQYIGYKKKLNNTTYLRTRIIRPNANFKQNIPNNSSSFETKYFKSNIEFDVGIERRKIIHNNGIYSFGISYSIQPSIEVINIDDPIKPVSERTSSKYRFNQHKIYLPIGYHYRLKWLSIGFEYAPFVNYIVDKREVPGEEIKQVYGRYIYFDYDAGVVITVHF